MNILGADRDLPIVAWPWLLFVIAAGFLLWRTLGPRQIKMSDLPPGPRNWPLNMGAFVYMEPMIHKAFVKLAAKFGPIVYFRLGVQTVVVVSSSEAAEEFLSRKDKEFLDRATAMTSTTAKYVGLGGESFAFCNYDAQLKLLRKSITTEFFTVAKVKSYEKLRRREMAVIVENIFAMGKVELDNAKDGHSSGSGLASRTVDVRAVVMTATRNLLFKLIFGTRFDNLPPNHRLQLYPEMIEEVMKLFMKFNMVDFFPILKPVDPQGIVRAFKDFNSRWSGFVGGVVDDQRQARKLRIDSHSVEEGQETNFIDVLLAVQEQGGKLSDNGVYGAVMTTLSAGIETMAFAVEWTMLELMRHPEIMRKLQDEVDRVVGKERTVNEEDMEHMPLLDAVVTESLRLHPPVPVSFPHVNSAPSTLGGYYIPANAAVFVNFYGLQRDPTVWQDPLQFKPSRFMQEEEKSSSNPPLRSVKRLNGTQYNMLPFGGGRRMCTGFNLAIVVVLRCVATLVHAFDWGPLPGQTREDFDNVNENGAFTLHTEKRLLLSCKPRLSRSIYDSGHKGT